jgi:hypothetical protein
MSATAGGTEVPSEDGAVATPTAQDSLALLREKVPKFQALDPRQRLLSVDLKLELQRHRGGTTHLPEQFRRKMPAGHEHLIVGNPALPVLYAAWNSFLTTQGDGGFDEGRVYSEQELTFQTGIQARPAAGAMPQGGATQTSTRVMLIHASTVWCTKNFVPGGSGFPDLELPRIFWSPFRRPSN